MTDQLAKLRSEIEQLAADYDKQGRIFVADNIRNLLPLIPTDLISLAEVRRLIEKERAICLDVNERIARAALKNLESKLPTAEAKGESEPTNEYPTCETIGPTCQPQCPKCGNSSQNGTPDGSLNLRRCASCKTVFRLANAHFQLLAYVTDLQAKLAAIERERDEAIGLCERQNADIAQLREDLAAAQREAGEAGGMVAVMQKNMDNALGLVRKKIEHSLPTEAAIFTDKSNDYVANEIVDAIAILPAAYSALLSAAVERLRAAAQSPTIAGEPTEDGWWEVQEEGNRNTNLWERRKGAWYWQSGGQIWSHHKILYHRRYTPMAPPAPKPLRKLYEAEPRKCVVQNNHNGDVCVVLEAHGFYLAPDGRPWTLNDCTELTGDDLDRLGIERPAWMKDKPQSGEVK